MTRIAGAVIPLLVLCYTGGVGAPCARAQGANCEQKGRGRDYWRQIAKNHYEVPAGQDAFPLARELSSYLCSPDPELRDDLGYTILASWIARQKKLSHEELWTLLKDWQANLRAGIGETEGDSVFRRSFSALSLAALAERDLKDPFLGKDGYRVLLEGALKYLQDECDLRGFDAKKGWIHATAHTADLLAALAENQFFTKQDQGRVLEAIAQRLATANEVFQYGEQDRLANIAAAIISRDDFDGERWRSWIAQMDADDRSVWKDSPPKMQALTRFENDSYFLHATIVQTSLRAATSASAEAQKTVLASVRWR
jgi:hypothetical protein